MAYHVVTRWGDSVDSPSREKMLEILAELDRPDREHPDTWLTHESGWTLSVYESGLLVWENLEDSVGPRHLLGVPRQKTIELWIKLAEGEIAPIEKEPWRPGAGPPLSPEEQERRSREIEEWRF